MPVRFNPVFIRGQDGILVNVTEVHNIDKKRATRYPENTELYQIISTNFDGKLGWIAEYDTAEEADACLLRIADLLGAMDIAEPEQKKPEAAQ